MQKICNQCFEDPFQTPKSGNDDVYSVRLTPVDWFGYAKKFCWVLPLKVGACVACFFTFIWALAEFLGANNQVADFFPDRTSVGFYVIKAVYLALAFGLVVADCLLLLGIIKKRYKLVNCYIWYISVYIITFVVAAVAGLVCVVVRINQTPKRLIIRMTAIAAWMCILFYLLVIVNSFKYTLWRSLIL